jgi:hypothetical protein
MKFLLFLFVLPSFGLYIPRRDIFKIAPLLLVNDEIKIKLCKDCKFFKKDFSTETKFGHCSHFPIQEKDNYYLVDGFKDTSPTSYHYCATARSSERMCGQEGKYFESK